MNKTTPTIHELLAGKTREQIIDAWMEDKLFLQGQVKRLQAAVRDIHTACRRASIDVVLEEQGHE